MPPSEPETHAPQGIPRPRTGRCLTDRTGYRHTAPAPAVHSVPERTRYRLYRPGPDEPTMSIVIDDAPQGPSGFTLYPTPTGYLLTVWEEATNLAVIRGYDRYLWGEPRDLILQVWGYRTWEALPDDGTGFWGEGDAPVDHRVVRGLEAAGLLVPHH